MKIKYIHAVKGSIVALLIFIIAAIAIPSKGPSREVEIILTVSTFLFAILAGFFISRLNSRYDKIREHIATEDAYWVSIYNESKVYGKNFQDKIRVLIDNYYIIAFDFSDFCEHYYKPTSKYFFKVYDEIVKINKYRGESSYTVLLEHLAIIEDSRNKASVLTEDKMTKGQHVIIISLAAIIIYSVYYLKLDQFYSQVISVLLSTIMILVLLLIRDLQNLRLGGKPLIVESGQEVFDFIGKLRYHNDMFLKNQTMIVPDHIKKYRVGYHKPGADDKDFDIRIVKR